MPQKTVNRFLFVRFRRCKNSSPAFPLAYKSTAAVAFGLQKVQTATALLTSRKVYAAAFVSVVSACCLVHFLTIVSNQIISQITSIARASFPLFQCAWIRFAAFVSVVSLSFHVSGCKVITFLPYLQINLQKSFLKNCKRTNKAFFGRACGVRAAWCKYATNIVFYICMCVLMRVRACVCVYVLNAAQKIVTKNFLKKVAKYLERKK